MTILLVRNSWFGTIAESYERLVTSKSAARRFLASRQS